MLVYYSILACASTSPTILLEIVPKRSSHTNPSVSVSLLLLAQFHMGYIGSTPTKRPMCLGWMSRLSNNFTTAHTICCCLKLPNKVAESPFDAIYQSHLTLVMVTPSQKFSCVKLQFPLPQATNGPLYYRPTTNTQTVSKSSPEEVRTTESGGAQIAITETLQGRGLQLMCASKPLACFK